MFSGWCRTVLTLTCLIFLFWHHLSHNGQVFFNSFHRFLRSANVYPEFVEDLGRNPNLVLGPSHFFRKRTVQAKSRGGGVKLRANIFFAHGAFETPFFDDTTDPMVATYESRSRTGIGGTGLGGVAVVKQSEIPDQGQNRRGGWGGFSRQSVSFA